jgi:LPS-assembly lipoprotein
MKPQTVLSSAARRTFLRRAGLLALAGGALGGLSACGFKLRGVQTFAFESLRMAGSETTPVAVALRRSLEVSGLLVFVSSTPTSPEGDTGQVVLTVLADQRERVVVGQTAVGQVRELQLRTRFRFRLRTLSGRQLLDDTELLLERDISFTETAVLAKDAEEALLFRDMQADIVQQVMRRLAAVKQ